MNSFLNFYQHLPERISPMAFHIGSFAVGWYALMYIVAFLTVYLLLRFRIRKGEAGYPAAAGPRQGGGSLELLEEFISYSFLGVVIGGRLGYILFYNLPYYLANPWALISPWDAAGKFVGIYGMSYHGGLIAVILATWYFTRKNKIDFLRWADFAVPAIPAGFFFGRIGNFLNGELYGRITAQSWGMYFSVSPFNLRHPSQLYEAFFEGLVLFLILWAIRNKKYSQNCHPELVEGSNHEKSRFLDSAKASLGMTEEGSLFVLYIFLYGLFRFFLEFFREPDSQLGLVAKWAGIGLTQGQLLSLGMVFFSVFIFLYLERKKMYNK